MTHDPADDIDFLIEAHLSGSLDQKAAERLGRLIESDPTIADRLARATADDEAMRRIFRDAPTVRPNRSERPHLFSARWLPAATAAAVLLVFALAVRQSPRFRAPTGDPSPESVVEKLAPRDGTNTVDDPNRLVVVDGARLSFSPDAVFVRHNAPTSDGRNLFELQNGRVDVEVPEGQRRLAIKTPNGTLRDTGTKFSVSVADPRKDKSPMISPTAILVFATVLSGLVEFSPDANPNAQPIVLTQDSGSVRLDRDGALGRVDDAEGLAYLRARGSERWESARVGRPFEAGWLAKTALRGANALVLRLANDVKLTLGPGAQIELVAPDQVSLLSGDLAVVCPSGVKMTVLSAKGNRVLEAGTHHLRENAGLADRLDTEPQWHAAFVGDRSTERMGSLVALVDGRNTPLVMGHHKVTVEIRDQLARTTIDESFINTTSTRLEGTFYFPLPGDASISGFAMWIGNEKVEGEIVEKERAREIYETILRERRDPGLLEWTGGNIFKARVFPIDSEKRIQIRYTQVLPKEGNTVAYRYPLRSDMLRTTPLKKLEIEVLVSSAATMESVACRSHPCRIDSGEHAARAEFSAEEYVPTEDFEFLIRLAEDKQSIRVLPHLRGEDGYFLAMIDAPGRPKTEARKPLDLVLLFDTSGSMNGPARATALKFVEGLVESLGKDDIVRLAVFDTETIWVLDRRLPIDEAERRTAIDVVRSRRPLGWTDLERAIQEALARSGKDTDIIVVGDGVLSKGDRDVPAFLDRIARSAVGRSRIHTVATGSSSDAVCLANLALIGGSMREVRSEADAPTAAQGLLDELSAPGVRDVEVVIEGVATAAVYPSRLGNIPAGKQSFVVGRFDPRTAKPGGRVVVRGVYDENPVSFAGDFPPVPKDLGNSFIPRLWAKARLDDLLRQTATPELKQKIIALSEDFQIATPYTSFLVLESDADRERFKVKRSVRMRDGEDFFAEGTSDAQFELKKKELAAARLWRTELRRAILGRYADLGTTAAERWEGPATYGEDDVSVMFGEMGGWSDRDHLSAVSGGFLPRGGGGGRRLDLGKSEGTRGFVSDFDGAPEITSLSAAFDLPDALGNDAYFLGFDTAKDDKLDDFADDLLPGSFDRSRMPSDEMVESLAGGLMPTERLNRRLQESTDTRSKLRAGRGLSKNLMTFGGARGIRQSFRPWPRIVQLLPGVAKNYPIDDDILPRGWTPEAVARVRVIDRSRAAWPSDRAVRIEIAAGEDGVKREYLIKKDGMRLRTSAGPMIAAYESWVDGEIAGALNRSWMIASLRKAEPTDRTAWTRLWDIDLSASLSALPGTGSVVIEPEKDGITEIRLIDDYGRPTQSWRIDGARKVLLESTVFENGVAVRTTSQDEWVEAAGFFFAAVVRTKTADGKVVSETRRMIREISTAEFDEVSKATARDLERALVVGPETPMRRAAERAVAENRATVADRWTLLVRELMDRRLAEAKPHADAILAKIADSPCRDLVKAALDIDFSRNEESRQTALEIVKRLAEDGSVDAAARYADVRILLNTMSAPERLEMLKLAWPLLDRHIGSKERLALRFEMTAALEAAGDHSAAIAFAEETVSSFPDSVAAVLDLGRLLRQCGKVPEGYDRLRSILEKDRAKFGDAGADIRKTIIRWLRDDLRTDEEIAEIDRLITEYPKSVTSDILIDRHVAQVRTARIADFEREIESALEKIPEPGAFSLERARFDAAVAVESGAVSAVAHRRISANSAERLVRIFRVLEARTPRDGSADTIYYGPAFTRTPDYRRLVKTMRDDFLKGLDELPLEKLARTATLVGSTDGDDPRWKAEEVARKIIARLKPFARPAADEAVRVLVDRFATVDQKVEYFRMLVAAARTPGERLAFESSLFESLRLAPWSEERENALFALLPRMAEADRRNATENNRYRFPERLRRMTDSLIDQRTKAAVAAIPDVNQKTRRVLAVLETEKKKESRAALLRRLSDLERTFEPESDRPNIRLERTIQEVRSGQSTVDARRALKDLLAPVVTRVADTDVEDMKPEDAVFLLRGSAALAEMTVRAGDGADATTIYFEFLDLMRAAKCRLIDPEAEKIEMLLALDRRAEAAAAANAAAETSAAPERANHLRMIAHMRAEDGDFRGAIAGIESAMKIATPESNDWDSLVRWHTVLGDKDAAKEARTKSFEAMDVDRLASVLYQIWQRLTSNGDGVPGTLDESTADAAAILLRKTQNPSWHLDIVHGLYATTKDFRIPKALAEAMVGSTEGSVYAVLSSMGHILPMLLEEAAADQVIAEIARKKAANPTAIDRRALDLLLFSVRYRMLEQKNGGRAHLASVLEALEASFKGSFSANEASLYAGFLSSMSRFAAREVADLAIRQLITLENSIDGVPHRKLAVMQARAYVEWLNDRKSEAIRTMIAIVDAQRDPKTRMLPQNAMDAATRLVSYLEEIGDWRAAERFWTDEIAREYPGEMAFEMEQQLLATATRALASGQTIALGRGAELYREIYRRLRTGLMEGARRDRDGRYFSGIIHLWNSARNGESRAVADRDLLEFAFVDAPKILANRRGRDDIALIWQIASRLIEHIDPAKAVEFLVGRAEALPAYLEMIGEGFWRQWSWQLAQGMQRTGYGKLSEDLAHRAWRIVEAELRKDLSESMAYNRVIYSKDHRNEYWSAMESRFVLIAKEIASSPRSDESIVLHCAVYVDQGLDLPSAAADMLLDRMGREKLTSSTIAKLVDCLEKCGRGAKALPIVRELVRERPEVTQYRHTLVRLLAAVGQRAEAERELVQLEKDLSARRAEAESAIASLAGLADTAGFREIAVRLYEEALNLRIRRSPSRGVGDPQTAHYYGEISELRHKLSDFDGAVAAAMAAIVVWPDGHEGRKKAVHQLEAVIDHIDDLDTFIANLEKEVATTKLENPILRRALGVALVKKSRHADAAVQFRKALETAPENLAVAELLVQALTAATDAKAARDAAWDLAEANGRIPAAFIDLGRRSLALGEKEVAERAFTNAIEISPNEAENHHAFAELREQSERLDEAAFHWGEVAKLRSLEPTGLLNQARLLIRLGRADEAKKDIEMLKTTKWDQRFAEDLKKIADLERALSR